MRRIILTSLVAAVFLATGCGPKGPATGTPPPPTKASLLVEGQQRVKRALAVVDEVEQVKVAILAAVPAPVAAPPPVAPPPEPKVAATGKKGKAAKRGQKTTKKAKVEEPAPVVAPAPAPTADTKEIDAQITRARELKDQIVVLREELGATLEMAAEPLAGKDLDRANGLLARLAERIGDLRDVKNRALELKPKEPEKEQPKPAAAPPAPAAAPAPAPAKK